MGWTNWWRKSSEPSSAGVAGGLGLDLNATRLRAMTGEGGRPRTIVLDEPVEELALAVAVNERTPRIGSAAMAIERLTPHLACFDFLAEVNQPRNWETGRLSYSATDLLALVIGRAKLLLPRADHIGLVLPPYLNHPKVTMVLQLLERARLPINVSAATPLALAAVAELPERRPTTVLVVDVDDYALSGSLVQVEPTQARLLDVVALPKLNWRLWKQRMLNGLADRCVRVCRRDPRDSASAEQALYEQIEPALDRIHNLQRVDLTVRSTHWYQNLILSAADFEAFAAQMVKPALAAIRELLQKQSTEPPQAIWLTHAAGRLPGLAAAMHAQTAERTAVVVLPADAGARAAAALTSRTGSSEASRMHLDGVISLPEAPARDATPVQYRQSNNPAKAARGRKDR